MPENADRSLNNLAKLLIPVVRNRLAQQLQENGLLGRLEMVGCAHS
jgi:hypothetical protein